MKEPGLEGRHRNKDGEIRHKRGDTLTLGIGAFKKVSAVEGIRGSDRLASDLRSMAKEHTGEVARTRYITDKYGKR